MPEATTPAVAGWTAITNADRAGWAQAAVDTFQDIVATDDCDAVTDLITNLCHLERARRANAGEAFDAAAFLSNCANVHDIEAAEDDDADLLNPA